MASEDSHEVLALHGQQLGERLLLLVGRLGEDQVLDQRLPFAEEHVLGTAQADALCAEATCAGGVGRGVRVGPNPEPPGRVRVLHDATHGSHELVAGRRFVALEVAYDE